MDNQSYIKRNFVTLKEISNMYKGIFSADMLRYMSCNDREFMRCVYRFTKNKVFVDLDLFEKWIDSKRQA